MNTVRVIFHDQTEEIPVDVATRLEVGPGDRLTAAQWWEVRQAEGARRRAEIGLAPDYWRSNVYRARRRRPRLAFTLSALWILLVLAGVGWVQQHEIARIVRDLAP